MTRLRACLLFLICLAAALWRGGTETRAADEPELRRYERCRNVVRDLLNLHPGIFAPDELAVLRDSVARLQSDTAARAAATDARQITRARNGSENAVMRIQTVLDQSAAMERVSLQAGDHAAARNLPATSGVVILRLERSGPAADTIPDFSSRDLDVSSAEPFSVETGDANRLYAILYLDNLRPGVQPVSLALAQNGRTLGNVRLDIRVPRLGRLKVILTDGTTGKPTPAVAGLYSFDQQIVVPTESFSFLGGGFVYPQNPSNPRFTKVRPYFQARYWPGTPQQNKVFFVDGGFSTEVPEGEYTLIAGKGPEYLPQVRKVQVAAGMERTETVRLERWVDMPSKGWYSGDGHVHYERANAEANRRLMFWAHAEDVHMINVVRMGDALETYFAQYAFGKAGRHSEGTFAIVPGQEDPRTSFQGHTLHMNLQAPVRYPEQYYLYDLVFDAVRKQGGLSGYAHAYQPPAMGFFVRQDVTLNVARGKIDFAEISEFGDIDTQLYYEFLNLGFKLTASAGSDVPWGNTIGTSRVYAYTGKTFDPDAWFRAVKAGNTFVTTGPMLEFTVNGQLPGSEIRVKRGETLRIRVRATSRVVPPRFLEVVSQGEVIRAARTETPDDYRLEFTLPVRHNTWIAARAAGAHTTPVYVRVDEGRFWKVDRVEDLVSVRLKQLDDIEDLIRRGTPEGGRGNWDNPEVLRKSGPALRERVALVRGIYQDLAKQAREELAARSVPRP